MIYSVLSIQCDHSTREVRAYLCRDGKTWECVGQMYGPTPGQVALMQLPIHGTGPVDWSRWIITYDGYPPDVRSWSG